MKKAIFRIVVLAILAGAGYAGYRYFKQGPQKTSGIATAKVQRGDVVIRAYTRGELRTVRTYPLYAPALNGTIQLTQLAPVGAYAKEKDLIAEYDDSELLASIDADNLSIQSTDETIKQQKLSLSIDQSSYAVTLLSAQYAVRRAELNVKQKDVLDKISGLNYDLQLEQAKESLDQTKINIDMKNKQADASLAIQASNRLRSQTDLARDLARLQQTKTLAPLSGLIAVKQNRGGNFNMGQQMPDIRVGDTLQAGQNVADILDLSEVELSAKVGELDRANLKEQQPVMIQLDAIPDKRFPGTIKTLSGTATQDVFSGDPSKKFDVVFGVDMRVLLTGLGLKQDKVDQIMNTATENAKKNLISFAPDQGGGRGGRGGGPPDMGGPPPGGDITDPAMAAALRAMMAGGRAGAQGAQGAQGAPGAQGGGQQGGGRQRGQGGDQTGQGGDQAARGGRQGGFGNMSDADRQKMTDLRQQMQNATGADRDKLQQQLTDMMQAAGMGRGRGGDTAAGAQGQAGGQGRGLGAFGFGQGRGGDTAGAQGMGGGRGQGGFGGGQGRGGDVAGGQGQAGGRGQGGSGGGQGGGSRQMRGAAFLPSQEERDNAKLPLPPEQDQGSAMLVLLRPGLLADVEVEIQKFPDALHVPNQAVFLKNGVSTVYVQGKDGKFSPREVQFVGRSESTVVLSGGVQPGELVALADPTVQKKDNKSQTTDEKKSSTDAMKGLGGK